MNERYLKDVIISQLKLIPCIAIGGLQQVGKTELAKEIAQQYGEAAIYLDMKSEESLDCREDPTRFLSDQIGRLVILDEVQAAPNVISELKHQSSLRRNSGFGAGHFILLGPDSKVMRTLAAEAMGAQHEFVELTPFQPQEFFRVDGTESYDPSQVEALSDLGAVQSDENIDQLWLRGGFPNSYFAENNVTSISWRNAFIKTCLESALVHSGLDVTMEAISRAWQLIAYRQSNEINLAEFAKQLGAKEKDAERLIDILSELGLLRRLQQWSPNRGKIITGKTKLYVRDSGLVHAQFGIRTMDDLHGHELKGPTWEGFCIEALINASPAATGHYFYRSNEKEELDLVIEFRPSRLWAVEFKKNEFPNLSAGFYKATKDIRAENAFVVHGGAETYEKNGLSMMCVIDALKAVKNAGH